MAKIIVTSRYFKNPSRSNIGKLLRYMGTREGVEKVSVGVDHTPATVRQKRLIQKLLKAEPDAKNYLEYRDYLQEPCRSNASAFLDAFAERNADRAEDIAGLVSYMAQRPGVEKLGSHGLFGQSDDRIDLDRVAEEVTNHTGTVWTHVISLHREDAERLGYNNANAWRDLVRRNAIQIAEAHKIDASNLQWYAAFHNTTHHPHIHLMVYSKDPKQGWLTKKSIDHLRSLFGNDIFRQEQYKLFQAETQQRNLVKERFKELIAHYDECPFDASPRLTELFFRLTEQLKTVKGKKVYGYLPKEIKETVDRIVKELAKDADIAALYAEWNKINREKLSLYYDRKESDTPLEDNPVFRSIKNEIIRAAAETGQTEVNPAYTPQQHAGFIFRGIVKSLLQAISASYLARDRKLNGQVDGKLKSKIEQKKAAHGLKTDGAAQEYGEDYEMRL